MTDVSQRCSCARCGARLAADTAGQPCPECGCPDRHLEIAVRDTIRVGDTAKVEQRHLGVPGILVKIVKRWKWSRGSGKPAREEQVYDRSAPDKTVKRHLVEEQEPDGSWTVVHDEHEEFRAKRRPRTDGEES